MDLGPRVPGEACKRAVPQGEAQYDEHRENHEFRSGEDGLHAAAAPYSQHIERGEQEDHGGRANLESGEPQRDGVPSDGELPQPHHVGQVRKKVGQVKQEAGGNAGDGGGLRHQKLGPAIEEPHHRAVGAVKIDVFSARLGEGSAQFRVAQRAKQAQNPRQGPYDDDPQRCSDLAEHVA